MSQFLYRDFFWDREKFIPVDLSDWQKGNGNVDENQ